METSKPSPRPSSASVAKAVSMMSGNSDELSWKKLVAIEKRRRAVLRRTELPIFRLLMFWDGTVLNALAHDALMLGTMAIYIAVRISARYGLPTFVSGLGGADIGTIGSFLSFFLVFFVVSSNNRFDTLYGTSMLCEKRIFDAAALAKTTMPRENALRLVRYMNAVHVTGYVGLSDTYAYNNFFVPENRLHQFLTPDEIKRMEQIDMDSGGACYRELLTWCCAEVTTANKAGYIDPRLASQLRDIVLKLGDAMTTLAHYADQPVSFFYVHFICLLSVLYLPMFAISSALDAGTGEDAYWVNDVVAGLIVALQCIFVIGLRVLGQKMNDPYGSDVEDLSVMHYVDFTWLVSRQMVETELPPPVDSSIEERVIRQARTIGTAWEDPNDYAEDGSYSAKATGISTGFINGNGVTEVDEAPEEKSGGGGCNIM